MAEETDFENGRNSKFEGLVTLTLTFDPAIRHIVLQQSSTSTYIPNFIQIEETFCGRTDVRTDGRTDGRADIFPLYIIRSTFGSRPKNQLYHILYLHYSLWRSHNTSCYYATLAIKHWQQHKIYFKTMQEQPTFNSAIPIFSHMKNSFYNNPPIKTNVTCIWRIFTAK